MTTHTHASQHTTVKFCTDRDCRIQTEADDDDPVAFTQRWMPGLDVIDDVRIEYGLRVDCSLDGCHPAHLDDGEVVNFGACVASNWRTPSGHAARLVKRTVPTTAWEEAPR